MNAMLKKDIETELSIHAQYDSAEKNGDEAGKQAARAAHKEHEERIMAQGRGYHRVFRMAMDAHERGNDAIDLYDCLFDKDIEPLMDSFQQAGITRFTFSSTWSGSVEIAWEFTQYGYQLKGITEINGLCRDIFTNEREKLHALVFEM